MQEDRTQIKVVLVDDHPLFRTGLAHVIARDSRLEIAGVASAIDTGFDLFLEVEPDLVVCDLSFGETSGLALIKRIRDLPSKCPILVLSMHEETFWAEQVLKHGANGYVQKDADAARVIEAILQTARGDIYLSDQMKQNLLRKLSGLAGDNTPLQMLSRREMEVFQYLSQGFSSNEIASSLFISLKTVQTHQANIKKKLGQASVQDLRRLARKYSTTPKSLLS